MTDDARRERAIEIIDNALDLNDAPLMAAWRDLLAAYDAQQVRVTLHSAGFKEMIRQKEQAEERLRAMEQERDVMEPSFRNYPTLRLRAEQAENDLALARSEAACLREERDRSDDLRAEAMREREQAEAKLAGSHAVNDELVRRLEQAEAALASLANESVPDDVYEEMKRERDAARERIEALEKALRTLVHSVDRIQTIYGKQDIDQWWTKTRVHLETARALLTPPPAEGR